MNRSIPGTVSSSLGREIDNTAAQEWYAKVLAFQSAEQTVKEKQRPYLQYRIGKMYAAGLGTEQDYKAVDWWCGEAVTANIEQAGEHFKDAFTGFFQLEKDSHQPNV